MVDSQAGAVWGCSEVVGATGDISTRQPRFVDAGCERAGPTLVWGVFFSRAIRTPSSQGGGDGESISPHNVFVAPDTWWGDIDFDAATKEAERIFKNIWPQASFLPALPDPDRQYQQEEEQLLLETEGTGDISATDFAPGRDVSVTFSDGMLGLQLEMDKQAGLIIVGGMADNGQAISSGRLSIGDILTTVAGQPVAAGISVEQVVKFLLQRLFMQRRHAGFLVLNCVGCVTAGAADQRQCAALDTHLFYSYHRRHGVRARARARARAVKRQKTYPFSHFLPY